MIRLTVNGLQREADGVSMEEAVDFMQARRALWSPYCSVASRVLWYSLRTTQS